MKLPQDISRADIVRCLQRLGFIVARQSGSHARLVKGDERVTIAMHRLVPAGTIQNVLRQAGLSIEQFVEAR